MLCVCVRVCVCVCVCVCVRACVCVGGDGTVLDLQLQRNISGMTGMSKLPSIRPLKCGIAKSPDINIPLNSAQV